MSGDRDPNVSPWLLDAYNDVDAAEPLEFRQSRAGFDVRVLAGARSLWIVTERNGAAVALRTAYDPAGELRVAYVRDEDPYTVELSGSSGRFRVELSVSGTTADALVHAKTWFAPLRDVTVPYWPRDLIALNRDAPNRDALEATTHTHQRRLRSGIVYATIGAPAFGTVFYFQNFTSLSAYFEQLHVSPADSVRGDWPEAGYAPPVSATAVLQEDREICISDAYVLFDTALPSDDCARAETYLDALARVYLELPKPPTTYHAWPDKARMSLQHLSYSDDCTYERGGYRYLMPYVGHRTQPPESMVQLTVLLPIIEYERWAGVTAYLVDDLLESLPSFMDSKIDALGRWPDGVKAPGPADVGGNTRNMDSWYLYHSMFNLSRIVKVTEESLGFRDLFARSIEYAIRVAHRFDYQWPVFYDLDTLEILRGETHPGAGGEHDVAGLYALVMIHAFEILGDRRYLEEAMRAAERLRGLGFRLAYQMNVTGFAAEAMLRLYLYTGEQQYLALSTLCIANVFDNMWLWDCNYGFAKNYRTFFGMFPLPDAPYLAAYEELEAPAKFREYLRIGFGALRPSVRLLLSEYCRYVVDRAWHYYPDALPEESLSRHPQNGHLDRTLAVPVEDLREGWDQSGQVGQEVYGAGIAMGFAARNYYEIKDAGLMVFCDYPAFRLRSTTRAGRVRITAFVAGDPRANAEFRLIPQDPSVRIVSSRCFLDGTRREAGRSHSGEGHLVFAVPGGSEIRVEIEFER